ncbi:hypothetical protein OIDMADRAFT_55899 [Oidiodendron maius Zn]|uniref:Transcription factor domain-containing protein n=1 Tax=Oidiodendron maius (strain Zn) TaxID=913774 RepID=A0A0C3CLV9_OIDMZ|nr:hypothetical protein OIDMADRAFT_55899 [Oidiodendron maius Zn]
MVESGFSREWAERAGELVSREILDPHEENIITFINLALFWYGQGNAIQICYLLSITESRPGDTSILQVEFSRRRFWACFLVGSFCSDTISSKELPDRALSLPLPCREADLCQGAYNSSCLNGQRDGNLYGELVRVMALWNSVCLLVGQQLSDTSSRVRAIQELDSKILEWRSAMPQSLELSAATISLVPPHTLPLLLLIHIVYHQCLCSLHASIIPLFSLGLSEEGFSYARQISAQIAFEHANSVSSLIEAMLEHSLDLSRLPSFVGYSAYCSCVIQAPFISCTKAGIRERALINVLANLRVIQQLGKFWKFIYLLGFNFRAVYAAHEKHPPSPNDEPRSMEIHNFNKFACCTFRVQTSILSHNEIVLRAGGSIAEKDNKVIDMGFGDTSHGCAPITDGGIALLINELSQLSTRQGETERSSSLGPTPCLVQDATEASQPWLDYGIVNGNCSIIPDDLEVLGEQMLVFDEWDDPFGVSADKYYY